MPDNVIKTSQTMIEAIMRSAVGAIVTIDARGIMQSVNPATLKLFGYREAELIGKSVNILMAAEHSRNHDGYISRYLTTGEQRIIGIGREVEGRRKDGSLFPVHLSVSEFDMRGERYFAGILHDLSTRTRLEDEVSRQSALFQAVFDHVPEPLILTDVDRTILHSNPAAVRAFGTPSSALNGKTTRILYASDEEYERVGDFSSSLPDEVAGVNNSIVASFRRKSGETFQGQLMAAVVRGALGSRLGLLGLIRDLTEDNKREEARLRTQRLEAIGQLTGGVAHDFNNLLTIITGNLELLTDYVHDDSGLDHCRRAQAAAEAGSRLTNRLLTFARRRRFDACVVDLNEHVVAMTELLKRTLGDNIQLSTHLASDLWKTFIDPSEIENAILNLAINARDAMPEGGKLLIETSNAVLDGEPTLSEAPAKPGNYVRLSVSDTGVGMTPDVLRRAFEPFFTTKAVGRGTGLGLSTIYGFIKQSDGNVAVYSELGKGTTVNLYLPQFEASGEDETLLPAAARLGPLKADGTVLVVEDNPDVMLVAVGRLKRIGYEVIEAPDAKHAIDLLIHGLNVDLVFSDMVMPGGLSGLDLARWIGTYRSDVAVVLTSGFSAEMIRSGADSQWPILRKPYTQAEMAEVLGKAKADKVRRP